MPPSPRPPTPTTGVILVGTGRAASSNACFANWATRLSTTSSGPRDVHINAVQALDQQDSLHQRHPQHAYAPPFQLSNNCVVVGAGRGLFHASSSRHMMKSMWQVHPKHRIHGWFNAPAGASKFKWHWQLPYQRLWPESLYHSPEVSKVTNKPIDWYNDEPQSGYEFRDVLGPYTLELTNIPMGVTPETMQERLRRFFSKFGHIKHCRVLPHSHDPYQCCGTGYVTFENSRAVWDAIHAPLKLPISHHSRVVHMRSLDNDKRSDPIWIKKQEHFNTQLISLAEQLYRILHFREQHHGEAAMTSGTSLTSSSTSAFSPRSTLSGARAKTSLGTKVSSWWSTGVTEAQAGPNHVLSRKDQQNPASPLPMALDNIALELQLLERSRFREGADFDLKNQGWLSRKQHRDAVMSTCDGAVTSAQRHEADVHTLESTSTGIAEEAVLSRFDGSWERFLTFKEFSEIFLIFQADVDGPPIGEGVEHEAGFAFQRRCLTKDDIEELFRDEDAQEQPSPCDINADGAETFFADCNMKISTSQGEEEGGYSEPNEYNQANKIEQPKNPPSRSYYSPPTSSPQHPQKGQWYVSPRMLSEEALHSALKRATASLHGKLEEELSTYWRKGRIELPDHTKKINEIWYHKPVLPWRLQQQSWPTNLGAPFYEKAIVMHMKKNKRNEKRQLKRAPRLAAKAEEKRQLEDKRQAERDAWNQNHKEKRIQQLRMSSFSKKKGLLANTSEHKSLTKEDKQVLHLLEKGKVADRQVFTAEQSRMIGW
ncbi:unnamed protein product [Amoebophrya sp. A25]|nr:unnamed protein product [Amoebophrya sp. A25]|eukprot:GSA25T00021967001.1